MPQVDWRALLYATTLRGLEAATICRVNDWADPEKYYAFVTPAIPEIRTPLLVLHAKDDPIIGYTEYQGQAHCRPHGPSPLLALILTSP